VFTRPDGTRLIALVNGIDWVQTHEPTHALDPADVRPPPPPATDVRVLVTGTPPSTAREALTGAPLAVEPGVDASSIALPAFAFMALVELD
jgi:hypothetical protein